LKLQTSPQLTAPPHSYVILAAASTFVLNTIHGLNTGKFRKAAKVDYPAAYAPSSRTDEAAHNFNCAQRAHANFTENHASMLGALLLAGLQFPITSALMGAGWTIARYVYMVGYSAGGAGGKGRYKGISFWLFQIGLIGLASYSGVAMILGW
jgi:glutathione S-transferase